MIPAKEKAQEIYKKMLESGDETSDFVYDIVAKKCALIAVEEILSIPVARIIDASSPTFKDHKIHHQTISTQERNFWVAVRVELNKI